MMGFENIAQGVLTFRLKELGVLDQENRKDRIMRGCSPKLRGSFKQEGSLL